MKLIKMPTPDKILNKIKSEREKLGQKIELNQSETKYSSLLLDLIQPFLSETPNPDDLFDMLDIGVIAWNTGNVKGIVPKIYDTYMKSMLSDKNVKKEDLDLFNTLVDRKVKEFSDHTHFIEDFELNEGKNGMAHVTVVCKTFDDVMMNGLTPLADETLDDNFNCGFINRSAIIVKPRQLFFDWLNKLYPNEPIFSTDENNIYLIKETDDNGKIEKWVKKNFDKLFINELNDRHTDMTDWPMNRTYKMFKEWFDYEITSMIYDLEEFPVTKY